MARTCLFPEACRHWVVVIGVKEDGHFVDYDNNNGNQIDYLEETLLAEMARTLSAQLGFTVVAFYDTF